MTIEQLPDGRYRLQLDATHGPIDIGLRFCTAPECTCRDITLDCEGLPEPLGTLSIDTEIDDWTLGAVQPDLPEGREIAQRILDALPYAARRQIFIRFEQKYATPRLEAYRMPPEEVRRGATVSYLDIVMGGYNAPGRWDAHYGQFELDGRIFLTDVRFCPNPSCDCRSIHPLFCEQETEQEQGKGRLTERLMLVWRFDGRIEVAFNEGLPQEMVDRLIAAWQAKHDIASPAWHKMYDDIKQVGKRILREERPSFVSAAVKPGRNDPCPCGSGKKYKRCCAA